ncbi:hypothetical protein [Desulfuromonas sp. DDH964]|uniref:hypothetical protein n=1 Tax=Desulfuromonas sp. DDH964 TaxID=1823759 RepID=UPI0018D3C487|nr:hypothetical protein [Desulfuromonas sp. DDH964]
MELQPRSFHDKALGANRREKNGRRRQQLSAPQSPGLIITVGTVGKLGLTAQALIILLLEPARTPAAENPAGIEFDQIVMGFAVA